MNEHLKKVIELSNVDREIDSFGPKELKLKDGLNKLAEKAGKISKDVASLEDEIREIGYRKNKADDSLKDLSSKLADISKKSNSVKSEREIKSLQIEEEIAREQIGATNEEIDRLDKLEESKKGKITELNSELSALNDESSKAQSELKGELDELEKEKATVYAKKEKVQTEINPKVNLFYQKIKRWAGNTAVVPVMNKACMGCHTLLTEESYRNAIRSEDIVTCANCGRIIYMPEQL
jgi:hypothetical protein